jgi:hypothetical protein
LIIGIWNLPFDLAQGGELVELFVIWVLLFGAFEPDVSLLPVFCMSPPEADKSEAFICKPGYT